MRHFSSKFDDARGRQPSLDEEEDQEPPRLRFRPTREKGEGDGDENSRQDDADGGNRGKEEGGGEGEDEEEEEEDDYMNMTFADAAPALPETSLQRRERLRREGLRRGYVPSKAELAAQERERREEGLSRSLIPDAAAAAGPTTSFTPFTSAGSTTTATSSSSSTAKKSSSKGLAMMARMGFKPGSALGRGGGGAGARSEPLRIEVKEDRGGIGADAERKRRLQEAAGAAGLAKRARVEELGDYRERMARERAAARRVGQVAAAQKIAERMDEEAGVGDVEEAAGGGDGGGGQGGSEDGQGARGNRGNRGGDRSGKMSSRPLRSVPVLYRGLVRQREEKERDRRMRYDLEQGSGGLSAKLPTYDDDDDSMDGDDRIALGRTEKKKKKTVYMPADDLDEEDPELDEFNELDGDEKLKRILKYLREKYRYCFWCKCAYPDEEMEGCPGLTEEDHD